MEGKWPGTPVVAMNRDGTLSVFMVGEDRVLYRAHENSTPAWEWSSMEGKWPGTPVVAANRDGWLSVFMVGEDRVLRRAHENSTPAWVWSSMGGEWPGMPVVAMNRDGTLSVFMVGEDRALHHVQAELSIDDLRQYYGRVSNHGPGRLTLTTFLGGFTLGAFAALLTVDPFKDIDNVRLSSLLPLCAYTDPKSACGQAANDRLLLVGAAAAVFLGVAATLLLLATVSGFRAMQLISDISPQGVKAFRDAQPSAAAPRTDRDNLVLANKLYDRGAILVSLAVAFSILSLVFTGIRINLYIGCFIAIVVALSVLHLDWPIRRGWAVGLLLFILGIVSALIYVHVL
jgi:hypothetical protein